MTTPNEIEYELELQQRGRAKQIKELEKAESRNYYSNTQSGRWTLQQHYLPFAELLKKETDKALTGVVTRANIARCAGYIDAYMEIIDPIGIGAIALKTLIDSYISQKGNVVPLNIANAIGKRIEDEIWFEHTQKHTNEEIASAARRRSSKKGSTPHYRIRSTKHVTKKKSIEQDIPLFGSWTQRHRVRVGLYLLEIATIYGVVDWSKVKSAKKQEHVVFADEFLNQVIQNEERLIARSYNSYPLIETPVQWDVSREPARLNTTGGYHLPQLRQRQSMVLKNSTDTVFGEKAVDLLNTLQSTAWRVDSRTLEVAEHLNEKRIRVGKFRVCTFDKPVKGNAPQHVLEDDELFKEWKSHQSYLHELYQEETKKAGRTREALLMAKEYQFKTFFHSWSCDWRGRFYTQQPWLTPLSTDFERSLLKFRDGCKIDDDALYWCKAAIAAAYCGTSISFNERIRWTDDNQELIKRIAAEPLSTINEWEAAKEPWQFLQLCFEWNDVVVTKKEKFWKVPIGVDSTASGLQLLSAMRRDSVGMKYANLLPPETDDSPPLDAYTKVLEVAKEIAASSSEDSHLLPYLEYRSVGKPALMLSVYGGSFYSISQDIKSALADEKVYPDSKSLSRLTKLILNASKQVFPAAYEALEWLKNLAKSAHKNDSESLMWGTPTKDIIHCIKNSIDTIDVYFSFNGKISVGDFETDKPDLKKQVSSFAPSVIHSYDAALLKEAFSNWQHPITVIHDCIRVLPSDMDRAMDRVRDGFTSIVSGDALGSLADDLGVSEEQLPRLAQLDGDLSAVLKSVYMFN